MYLFFDTETTGATNSRRIIQIGWTLTDEAGNEFRSHCFIVRPDNFNIPFSATRTHHVTTDVARRNGIEIGVALDAFSKDVAIAEFLIAHNAQFDRNIICDELLRVGRNDILAGKNLYCTMQSSADFCKIKRRHGYKWPNLEELHISLFGDTFDDAHNALSDARACAKCFFELRRRGVEFGNQVSNDHTGSDDDYLTIEDQELLDELETLEEFLRRSERKWVNRFIAQFQLTRQLSEKQRNILSSIRFKAEDRV